MTYSVSSGILYNKNYVCAENQNSVQIQFSKKQEVKVIWQKVPHGGGPFPG